MSPPRTQNQYDQIELTDFTGGLWSRGNDRECPGNGLLECTDAYPLPAGGIRAFARFQPMTQTGIGSGADATGGSVPFGIYSHPGVFATTTIYMTEFQVNAGGAGVHTLKMMSLSGENDAALISGTWSAAKTITGITNVSAGIKTTTLRNETDYYKAYFDLACLPSSLSGVYRFNSTGSTLAFNSNAPHGLISNQARLMFITHETTVLGVPNQIQYTNVSTDAAPSTVTNFVTPLSEASLPIQWIVASAPSDLLGLKLGRGIFNIQGDITAAGSRVIRELSFDQNCSVMFPVTTNIGLAFHVENSGIFLWNGGEVLPLSGAILGDVFGSAEMAAPNWSGISFNYRGQLAVGEDFLYAGQYVMDLRTRAWFKMSGMDYGTPTLGGMPAYAMIDQSNHRVYIANYGRFLNTGSPRQVLWWSNENEEDWTRSNTFSVTLPLIELATRQVDLRGVEIFGQGFGTGGSWTVSTTVGGVSKQWETQTFSALPIAKRWNTHGHGDNVKIRIQAAGTGTSEAPMISKIVLYFQARQMRAS